MVHEDLPVDRIYYRSVWLPPGATLTWETTSLSPGADTVMHLWHWSQGEVAEDDDSGAEPGASRITFTNDTATSQSYTLFVRAHNNGAHGTARLLQDGSTLVPSIPVGGLYVNVDEGPGYTHEVVAAPGGPDYLLSLGRNSGGELVEVDFFGGVGYGTRLTHDEVDEIFVGSIYGAPGPVNVLTNNPLDNDGDGLGYLLEEALGTCDSPYWSACTDVHDLTDTDRDGLSDAAEVFGIDDTFRPQYLPKWGADPRHKDVFVEVDYSDDFTSNPVTEDDVLWSQAVFMDGSDEDLQNPDGEYGVRLHVDIDKACPTAPESCGDWNGSNSVPADTNYKTAPSQYRDAARTSVFRYSIIFDASGGGQSDGIPSDRFKWGGRASNRHMGAFTHELGHSIGLAHYGHWKWGWANGKPNYRSLMNYAYGEHNFSLGEADVVLNPAVVVEQSGIGADAAYLEDPPWNREVGSNDEVDWDFDLEFSGSSWAQIKAPITYATNNGTGAFTHNSGYIHSEDDLPGFSPALVRGPGDRMYAFYIDDGAIHYRFAEMDGSAMEGSCPGGDSIGAACTSWSSAYQAPLTEDASGLSVVYEEGAILILYRGEDDMLRMRRMLGLSDGTLIPSGTVISHWAYTDEDPELEVMRVDPGQFGGDDRVVAIFYRNAADGRYRWKTMASAWSGWSTYRGELQDETGAPIQGTQGPAFTSWPYDPFSVPDGTSCGALTNTSSRVGLYCYDRDTNRFEQMNAFTGNGPYTSGKPGLVYHAYRSVFGVPREGDPTRGALWLAVAANDPDYDIIRMWISDPISEGSAELLQDLVFPNDRDGLWQSVWANVVDGSGLSLYDDADLGAMKALAVYDKGADPVSTDRGVRFFPLADGSVRVDLRDGNDFRVMERGICQGLTPGDCGSSTWGLN